MTSEEYREGRRSQALWDGVIDADMPQSLPRARIDQPPRLSTASCPARGALLPRARLARPTPLQ